MFFRKIVNIIQGPLKQIDRIAMNFEFANKPIKHDPGISKLMKITLPNLNEMGWTPGIPLMSFIDKTYNILNNCVALSQ